MPSASSPIRDALEGYVAGRVKAERLVVAVSAAYYGEAANGKRETLRPLIDIIERASPGVVELGTATAGPGFDIRLAERPFPKQHEQELRRAAEAVLSGCVEPAAPTHLASRISHPVSRISHLVSWIRRWFAPSA